MKLMNRRLFPLIPGFSLTASAAMFLTRTANAAAGPVNAGTTNDAATKENALKAEEALSQAMRTNDAEAFRRLVDPDWAGLLPCLPLGYV